MKFPTATGKDKKQSSSTTPIESYNASPDVSMNGVDMPVGTP